MTRKQVALPCAVALIVLILTVVLVRPLIAHVSPWRIVLLAAVGVIVAFFVTRLVPESWRKKLAVPVGVGIAAIQLVLALSGSTGSVGDPKSSGDGQQEAAERCDQALDELSSRDIETRANAIEELSARRRSCQHLRDQTVRTLASLVRQRAPYDHSGEAPDVLSEDNPALKDVYLAVRLIATEGFVPSGMRLNLEDTELRNLQLDITADLENVSLAGSQIDYFSHLPNANLRNADLTETQLDHATLTGADLDGATAVGALFIDANLERASFNSTDVTGADFTGRDYTNPACLNDADLEGAIGLDRAQLNGAIANAGTKWPPGFHPEAHGVQFDRQCRAVDP